MIINKETMIDAIRELGHVTVTETTDLVLVRSEGYEVTIVIKPVYTGTTITRLSVACYQTTYIEYDHDEREYKTLNGLIDYIAKHIPLLPSEIYVCKNDRAAKNRFKQLIQYDIKRNNVDYFNYNDEIAGSTENTHFAITIKVINGVFEGKIRMYKTGVGLQKFRVNSFINLQSKLYEEGVI